VPKPPPVYWPPLLIFYLDSICQRSIAFVFLSLAYFAQEILSSSINSLLMLISFFTNIQGTCTTFSQSIPLLVNSSAGFISTLKRAAIVIDVQVSLQNIDGASRVQWRLGGNGSSSIVSVYRHPEPLSQSKGKSQIAWCMGSRLGNLFLKDSGNTSHVAEATCKSWR
jgi:ABC-type transport system involved in multi-copper enzyme maturation permease subunit